MNVLDQLQDEAISTELDLIRMEAATQAKVSKLLNKLESEIVDEVQRADLNGVSMTAYKQARLSSLLAEVKSITNKVYKQTEKTVTGDIIDAAKEVGSRAAQSLNGVLGTSFAKASLPPTLLEKLVSDTMVEGAPSAEWWKRQPQNLVNGFTDQMRIGIAKGDTTDQLIRRIRGFPARNGEMAKAGLMTVKKHQAAAIVRTSMQTITNEARLTVWKQNDDLVKGVLWVATLDNRTTPICRALDGKGWVYDSSGTLVPEGHGLTFPGATAHWGCRSVQIPWTKTWAELTEEANKAGAIPKDSEVFYHFGSHNDSSTLSPLTFFTSDKKAAESYAANGPGQLHKVYLAVKKPAAASDVIAAARKLGYGPGDAGMASMDDIAGFEFLSPHLVGRQKAYAVMEALKKKGFDGAKFATDFDLGGNLIPGGSTAIFKSSQVVLIPKGSFRELAKKLDDIPKTTRASMNGQVPKSLTYDAWLKTQPEDVARKALGTEANFRLWQASKVVASPSMTAAVVNQPPRFKVEVDDAHAVSPDHQIIEERLDKLKSSFDNFLLNLDRAAKEQIKQYSSNSTSLNRYLSGTVKIDADYLHETKTQIKVLDAVFSKAPPMPDDVVAFSGLQGTVKRELMSLKVGEEMTVKRYLSSSISGKAAEDFVDEHHVFMQIAVPKGSRNAMYIEAISNITRERELLFNRGSTFKLLGKKKVGSNTYYIMEAIEK